MTELLRIDRLALDGGCQPRAGKLLDVIEDYAAAMVSGAEFPPVIVFYDGTDYWLADGYHRRDAAVAAGRTDILADIRQGTRRDAILFSVGANSAHGLRRTNEDKRRSVMTLLNDPEWAQWNNSKIARQCGVDEGLVRKLKPAPSSDYPKIDQPRTVERGGTTYTMNTGRIGGTGSRPAFDRSDFAQADPDERDLVPPRFTDPDPHQTIATERGIAHVQREREQERRDRSDDPIWHGLRSLIETVRALPSPSEAAARVPHEFEHSIRAEDVTAAANWLAEFAPLWAAGQQDRDQRTGAMVERAKGMMGNVTTH